VRQRSYARAVSLTAIYCSSAEGKYTYDCLVVKCMWPPEKWPLTASNLTKVSAGTSNEGGYSYSAEEINAMFREFYNRDLPLAYQRGYQDGLGIAGRATLQASGDEDRVAALNSKFEQYQRDAEQREAALRNEYEKKIDGMIRAGLQGEVAHLQGHLTDAGREICELRSQIQKVTEEFQAVLVNNNGDERLAAIARTIQNQLGPSIFDGIQHVLATLEFHPANADRTDKSGATPLSPPPATKGSTPPATSTRPAPPVATSPSTGCVCPVQTAATP
jgi:hypothetical protein